MKPIRLLTVSRLTYYLRSQPTSQDSPVILPPGSSAVSSLVIQTQSNYLKDSLSIEIYHGIGRKPSQSLLPERYLAAV